MCSKFSPLESLKISCSQDKVIVFHFSNSSERSATEKLVRVLVGRSEVLRPRFEQQLLSFYNKRQDKKESYKWMNQLGDRYGIAYQKRVQDLLGKKVAAK